MRLKDLLDEKELIQFEKLQSELLEAPNSKERFLIQLKIKELLRVAQSRYDSMLNRNEKQKYLSSEPPMRVKDLLTEEEDIKLQELKMELLAAPNDKVRTMILKQINEILDSAENRYHTLDEEASLYTMQPIKFTIENDPHIYKLFKLEHEGHYTYTVLVIKDGELITEMWPVEMVERNINSGMWKEVN